MKLRCFGLLVGLGAVMIPELSAARLARPPLSTELETMSGTVQVGAPFDVALGLAATTDVSDVTAELVPSAEFQVVSGPVQWSGALTAGDPVTIPYRIRLLGTGDYVVRARITGRVHGRPWVGGDVLYVSTLGTIAEVSRADHFTRKLARAADAKDLADLGLAVPDAPTAQPDSASTRAVTGTVHGTISWTDPEGNVHPIRGALVQVYDGSAGTGALLATTGTGEDGRYTASVSAGSNQVSVRVYTVDNYFDPNVGFGRMAVVHPPGQPNVFYTLTRGPVALTADLTLDFVAAKAQRGSAQNPDPTPNSESIRAFSVYDAARTYWHQGSALLHRSMPIVDVHYPGIEGTCGSFAKEATCFARGTNPWPVILGKHMAYSWDVIGHEFVHFFTHVFQTSPPVSGRLIDSNPGGCHSGRSAIGENPDNCAQVGASGRSRQAGLADAWAEGLATALALLLQEAPLQTVSPFPSNLRDVANGEWNNGEDGVDSTNMEHDFFGLQGFAAERSVFTLLWDLWDNHQDCTNTVCDKLGGFGPDGFWAAITSFLPCNPCDTLDKFWVGILKFVGAPQILPSGLFDLANLFVMVNAAPRAVGPADGTDIAGGVPPTFQWTDSGDPNPLHKNDEFKLVFSKDNFASRKTLTPPKGATSYTPTPDEWLEVQQGSNIGDIFKWYVEARSSARAGSPSATPAELPWYSNVMTFTARTLHFEITWTPLGADVDLHVRPPAGATFSGPRFGGDISWENTNPGWGNLDKDCIRECTEEKISLDSFPQTGLYRVFAHYYEDDQKGPATVHSKIFYGGALFREETFTLAAKGAVRDIAAADMTATTGDRFPVAPGPGAAALDGWSPPPKPKPSRGE